MATTIMTINSRKHGEFQVIIPLKWESEIRKYTWCVAINKAGTFQRKQDQIYIMSGNVNGKKMKLHRFVMELEYGPSPQEVNHINGNTLDNSLENLEYTNENLRGAKRARLSTSTGERNICHDRQKKRFKVKIYRMDKSAYTKCFSYATHGNIEQAFQEAREYRNQHIDPTTGVYKTKIYKINLE